MTPDEDPGGHEIDALDELMRSDGYELIVQRTAEVLVQQRSELESRSMAKTPEDANYIRGMIAGLKLSLDLPQMLIVEIQADIKKKR